MDSILEKASRLIWQNRSKTGGTKLLYRARDIEDSDKLLSITTSYNGHSKAMVEGSNGERYEAWLFTTGKVYCSCAFFEDLEPFQRQALGCKHILAHALRLLKQQRAA